LRYKVPGNCSICGHEILISNFKCSNCHTKTEGEFVPCRFCKLSSEQLDFIEMFLRCRGNIKDLEKVLGISYPTIRNRLEETLALLGLSTVEAKVNKLDKKEAVDVLDALERGDITPEEALKKIRPE